MKQNRSLSKAIFNFASTDLIIFADNNNVMFFSNSNRLYPL